MSKITVPENLRALPLFKQVYDISQAWEGELDSEESSDLSRYNKTIEPVKYFINYCLGSGTDSDVINYLNQLFYSVKGTTRIFDYMKYYLGLNITETSYNVQTVTIQFSDISFSDEIAFRDALEDFLSALLYWEELDTNAGKYRLVIQSEVANYAAAGTITYKLFKVESE